MVTLQHTPYALLSLAVAAASAALAVYAWRRRRDTPGVGALALLMLAAAWWAAAYALELAGADLATKVFWAQAKYPGVVAAPAAWLVFARRYAAGPEGRIGRRTLALLSVEPLATLLLVFTNEAHHLVWTARLDASGPYPMLDVGFGAWFWVNTAYSYLLILVGAVWLVRRLAPSLDLYRTQGLALLVGLSAPWAANVLRVLGLSPVPHLDPTPFAFALTGAALVWGLSRSRLLDLVPVARDATVEGMRDGLIVVDARDRVVDLNPSALRVLGHPAPEVLGRNASEVVPGLGPLLQRPVGGHGEEERGEARLGHGAGRRDYELRVSALGDGPGEAPPGRVGRVVLLRDVTERKRAEEALKESEANLREAQRIARLGSWEIDLATGEMRWSDEMYRVFGFAPREVVPSREVLTEATHPRDRKVVPDAIRDAVEKRRPFDLEHRVLRRDGEVRYVQARGEAVFGADGRPAKLFGTSLDVTERRRAEEELRRSESRLLAAQRIAHVGDWTFDVVGNEARWSDEIYRIFGLGPGGPVLTYRKFLRLVHPADRRLVRESSREALHGASRSSIEYRVVRPDGGVRFVYSQYEVRRDVSGRAVELFGILQDVTESRRAEEELRRSEVRNRAVLAAVPDLMFRVSRDGEYLDFRANDDAKLFVTSEEIVGKNLRETMPPDLGTPMLLHVARTLDTGEMQVFEYKLPVAEGVLDFEARLVVSGPEEVLGIVRDVTERKVLQRRLEHQAFHDELTGLPNRALFLDRLGHALAGAERRENRVAVLFMDLDNFKVVNDSLTHEAGDRLLVSVARRLEACLGPGDTVARLGGDEFAVLLEDAGPDEASALAERIATQLEAPFVLDGGEATVASSIGIALGGAARERPADLLRNADLAMYAAKAEGKNGRRVFEEDMNARAVERLRLENELRRAVELGEFSLRYQPQVELATGRIVGFEALVRWEHLEKGTVSPADFVPLAEETGLIVPIGRWVLEEACRQARQWQEQRRPSDPPPTISVNLSARQFRQRDLAKDVTGALDETGLDARCLDLEITESLAMEDTRRTTETLGALKELGVRLSVDDFGTGHSSLSYLKHLPVDFLKIDRSFVAGLGHDPKDETIVSGTVGLAHGLGLRTIAEGVETEEQLRRLRELGCDEAQGYLLAKPLPSREAAELLAGNHPLWA